MNETVLQILLVEDSAEDARLLREMFRTEKPGSFELTHVLRFKDAEAHLANARADIILLDMGLPDAHGIDTVRRAHAMAPGVPVIVLTGLDDEGLAAEAMKEGAQDYLIKGQIESRALPRTLRHAIERQRMQTESDLVRTYQIRFKDEFLSHVSHELRSPLNAIYQFVTILLDKLAGDLNPLQSVDLAIVLKNVKQLQSMINDLFEVTGSQTGKLIIELQPVSLPDAVADSLNTLQWAADGKKIKLTSDIPGALPPVYADPTRIRQILVILVENAIKFTPANGAVDILVRRLDRDPDLLLLEISDSGCGISPDSIERIFERLFQEPNPVFAPGKGLGLGLYICKDLVVRQGGHIWAKSRLGQGTVFSVTLPIFSLFDLIAPTIRAAGWDGPLALVVTEIGSETGWLSSQVRSEQSHGVREVLQQCLHPGLNVLLPRMGVTGAVELFFVLTATDQTGAEELTQRIAEQFDSSDQINRAGLTHSTSYQLLKVAQDAIKPGPSESMENHLEKVAIEVKELLHEEISRRVMKNGE